MEDQLTPTQIKIIAGWSHICTINWIITEDCLCLIIIWFDLIWWPLNLIGCLIIWLEWWIIWLKIIIILVQMLIISKLTGIIFGLWLELPLICWPKPAFAATSGHMLLCAVCCVLRCAAPCAPRAHTRALPVPSERREGLRALVHPSEPRRGEEWRHLPPSYRLPTTLPFT